MQRVLSFQMARGFGESSEFVTKRMCFSFLFSVGFLCLLCGFLTGRFAAGRAVDLRDEKTRLQLAGNGLEGNEYLREFLVQKIHENSLVANYSTDLRDEEDFQRIREALLNLQYFHRVEEHKSCMTATLRGSHEPDRHVVLSGSGEGARVIVEFSKALKYLKEDYDWTPRRTIKLIISLKSSDACQNLLMDYRARGKVVSYIELDVESISASGYFVTTGSDIVRTSLLQAGNGVKNPHDKYHLGKEPTTTGPCREIICVGLLPRLRLDIPNAVITFVSSKDAPNYDNGTKIINYYRQAIGEIIGTSVWRLSEMTLFKWNPTEDNKLVVKILQSLNFPDELDKTVETIVNKIEKIARNIEIFNEKMDKMETTLSLEVRMANDLSVQVRSLLLCNDENLRSRTDSLTLEKLTDQSTSAIDKYLRALNSCYETANRLLQEDVT